MGDRPKHGTKAHKETRFNRRLRHRDVINILPAISAVLQLLYEIPISQTSDSSRKLMAWRDTYCRRIGAGRRGQKHGRLSLRIRVLWEPPMLDVILLAVAAAFFALSIGYTFACDRL